MFAVLIITPISTVAIGMAIQLNGSGAKLKLSVDQSDCV